MLNSQSSVQRKCIDFQSNPNCRTTQFALLFDQFRFGFLPLKISLNTFDESVYISCANIYVTRYNSKQEFVQNLREKGQRGNLNGDLNCLAHDAGICLPGAETNCWDFGSGVELKEVNIFRHQFSKASSAAKQNMSPPS